MASFKSILKGIVLVISGVAIVVVGGFMMGAVARLWLPKDKKEHKNSSSANDLDDVKKAD
jgi:Na+-transporting methylmalonyl-CoA/oxaloacetate decarboxylase gamma subunit